MKIKMKMKKQTVESRNEQKEDKDYESEDY